MSDESLERAVKAIQSEDFKGQLQTLLPPDVPIERFIRTTLNAIQMNPSVLEADRHSLYFAIQKAAQWNLMPDGRQGALVVYNTKGGKRVQFMVMVEGALTLLNRAGYTCYAANVYEKEKLELWYDDTGQHIKHQPNPFGVRGDRVGVYAVARRGEQTYVATMDMDELARVRTASRAKDSQGNPVGPWKDWPEQMEQKSVIHRLRKRLSLSDEVIEALADEPIDVEVPVQPAADKVTVVPSVEGASPATAAPVAPKPRPKALQALVEKANAGEPDAQQEPPTEPESAWEEGLDL